MRVDTVMQAAMADIPRTARALEDAGYDAVMAGETNQDPMLLLTLAAEHTRRAQIMSSIVVAFARTPMTVALPAHELQSFSGGRFALGLGSQVRPHVENRFAMPWSHPAPRMREFIAALRAIWASWREGTRLDFRGDFYQHTLMTPMFVPRPHDFGDPPVFLAAVGAAMTAVAAESADGILLHGFTNERYLRTVTLPAVADGLRRAGRPRAAVQLALPTFVVTGDDEREMSEAAAAVRDQVAFYASTPAYRGVLEVHGWGDLQSQLNELVRARRWSEMGALISDDILDAFAVVAPPERVAAAVLERFGDAVDRVTLHAVGPQRAERWAGIVAGIAGAQPAASTAS